MRVFLLLLLSAVSLWSATFKLYLKDGGYHIVREYQVQDDRIRYFSTERGDWEEIPEALVDLDKTEHERKVTAERASEETRQVDEEEKAGREQRREIEAVPMETGAYFKEGGKIRTLALADFQVVTNKKRKALQVLSPIPLVPGKASVVVKGERSTFIVHGDRPDFYMRLAKEERFGIIRLTPKKGLRVVEDISIVPVSKEAVEERKQINTFEQELAPGLFRIWPEKTLTPGQYALVEFSDTGDKDDTELLVWDFDLQPGQSS